MKIVVKGELILTEINTGKTDKALVGNGLYFTDGDHSIFDTHNRAVKLLLRSMQVAEKLLAKINRRYSLPIKQAAVFLNP